MPNKRMLIIPEELAKRIDDNRGDMSQAEFIGFLIDSNFKEDTKEVQPAAGYATVEELHSFEQDIKKLLKSFLDFFVTYGLELGKPSLTQELEELTSKLQGMEKDYSSDNEKRRATIKYK